QTYKHSVPRFFVPEHGTMFTLALVRFPPTATKEIQYLNAKGALTYTDIAGDPVLYGNLPPREISMKDVELLLLVYELNRSGLLAENEKIRPILAQLEKLLLCDLSPSTNDSVKN